jgi:RNA methyltransferase, TrmH family
MRDQAQIPTQAVSITSRENPLLKDLRRLAHDNTAYRKRGQFWVEGDHLCRAAIQRGLQPVLVVLSESYWPQADKFIKDIAIKKIVISDRLFAEVSSLESPAQVGLVLELPNPQAIQADAMTVVLDRVQDAGNVGSILRSAAAFGFHQVLALTGTAALWSPKVLRAGMGAHFGLSLMEGLDMAALQALQVPLIATSSHTGKFIHEQKLPRPCAWVFGHEGQGVCAELLTRAGVTARIAQPGGEESLNVAAAASICLYATASGQAR